MTSLVLATLLAPMQPVLVLDESAQFLTDAAGAFAAGVESRADAVRARLHFKAAAEGFDAVWVSGDRSPRLAVNRGRSHFLAGNTAMAVVAFRAGLRDTPYDAELLRGLAECRAAIHYPTPTRPEERMQPDTPRGWRNSVSEWDVFRLGGISALVLVIGLARRFTARDDWSVPVAAAGGAGVLVCLLLLWKFDAERAADEEPPSLVVRAEVYLRKGNGMTHPPRIDATLPRGTEVRERTRRGGWVQVEVAGGAVGWLPEGAVRPVD